jgi:hypothetical protein
VHTGLNQIDTVEARGSRPLAPTIAFIKVCGESTESVGFSLHVNVGFFGAGHQCVSARPPILGSLSWHDDTYKVHLRTFASWCETPDLSLAKLTTDHVRTFLAERQAQSQSRLIEPYRRLRPFFRRLGSEGIVGDSGSMRSSNTLVLSAARRACGRVPARS